MWSISICILRGFARSYQPVTKISTTRYTILKLQVIIFIRQDRYKVLNYILIKFIDFFVIKLLSNSLELKIGVVNLIPWYNYLSCNLYNGKHRQLDNWLKEKTCSYYEFLNFNVITFYSLTQNIIGLSIKRCVYFVRF